MELEVVFYRLNGRLIVPSIAFRPPSSETTVYRLPINKNQVP